MNDADIALAARRGAAVFLRDDLAWFAAEDADRVRFLHNILTNVVEGVPAGTGNHASLLSGKGKLVAELHVLVGENDVLLGTHVDAREEAMAHLDRYIIADEVELVARDWSTISVTGPDAVEMVEAILGSPVPASPHDHARHRAGGVEILVTRLPGFGLPSVELLVPPVSRDALADALAAAGAVRGSAAAADLLRLEAGTPVWGAELGEHVIPLEARLDETLHRTKGCYLGQETIVRVLARGHVNWLLCGLAFEGEGVPARNAAITRPGEEKEIGRVTRAAWSPALGRVVALARIRREVSEPGTLLAVEGAGEARVVEVPFR